MKIMYWNCTAPDSNSTLARQKKAMIAERVKTIAPDILCLDEVSSLVEDVTAANRWMQQVGLDYICIGTVVNSGTHLNTIVYCKTELKDILDVDPDGIPSKTWDSKRTKRNLIRVTYQDRATARSVKFWFIHANASQVNGKHAVQAAIDFVEKNEYDMFIGDFNASYDSALSANIVAPILTHPIDLKRLQYSQWKIVDSQRDGTIKTGTKFILPGNVLDYAVINRVSSKVFKLQSIDSLTGMDGALQGFNSFHLMHIDFDHFPIAYHLEVKQA